MTATTFYSNASPIENIRTVCHQIDVLVRHFPDLYVVIDTSTPVNQQALCLVDYDAACTIADMGNRDADCASQFIVVKVRDLEVE